MTSLMKDAHAHSIGHREEIEESGFCGCFHCVKRFDPEAINEWADGGQTALCPHCGIDAVLGDASGFALTDVFLREMQAHWFTGRA